MTGRRLLLAAALAALGLPTGTRAQSPTTDDAEHARPFAALSHSAERLRDSLVALARAQVGTRYVLGGSSPSSGFDCSGLVRYIMSALDIQVPRTAAQQARVGRVVPRDTSHLRPGDLVTFGTGSRVTHIGIYVGEGRFVHASTKAGKVVESPLLRPRFRGVKPWRGVRRLLGDADTSAVERKAG